MLQESNLEVKSIFEQILKDDQMDFVYKKFYVPRFNKHLRENKEVFTEILKENYYEA